MVEKRFKRLFNCLIYGIVMTLSVSSCTNTNSKDTNGSSETTTTPSVEIVELTEPSPTPTPTPTDVPTPSPTPTPTPLPEHILVSFAGDCTLAEALAWRGASEGFMHVVGGDMDYCFQNAVDYFRNDDMTLVNFEGTLTDETSHMTKEFVFGAPFEYVNMLTNAGIESVNLSNNHSLDYWQAGLQDTEDTLDDAGVLWCYENNVSVYEVRGIRIGMCGYDTVSNGYGTYTLFNAIDQLKELECNIIIVSMHWGVERDYSPRYEQTDLGHQLIDYGADIVIGHHPHRLQPIERYNGKYIVYSLSNFVFGGNYSLSDPDSAIVQCEFIMDETNTYCVDYRLNVIPFLQTSTRPGNDYCPCEVTWGSSDYYRILGKLNWSDEDE
ncbi:MAG: CapA family protein [Clostridia bacterium]|nr:CapA family protein [Clostridia bacterium]